MDPVRIYKEQLESTHRNENIEITALGEFVVFYRCFLEHYEEEIT